VNGLGKSTVSADEHVIQEIHATVGFHGVSRIAETVDDKKIKLLILHPDGVANPCRLYPYNGSDGHCHQHYEPYEPPFVHNTKLNIYISTKFVLTFC
jgi:hypothetical protein